MIKKLKILSVVVLLLLSASLAMAQERGSVRGVVKSEDGKVIEGATVIISGQPLPLGREFITGKDGGFFSRRFRRESTRWWSHIRI